MLVGLFGTAYAVGERLPGHSHTHASMVGMNMGGGVTGSADGVSADTLGLSQVVAGYRLVVDEHTDTTLTFHLERDGERVTDFTEQHAAMLHLLLVRHDLTGYQHLHPSMGADGTWTAEVDLSAPGVWRMVADSAPADAGGILALGTDIVVPGEMTAEPLPPAETMVETDGLMIMRDGMDFTATLPDGSPAPGLDRYLGQSAHLVAFRQGDLAYQHLHPDNDVVGDYRFSTPLPGPGTYRLFLQFTQDGQVVTVPFTVVQP